MTKKIQFDEIVVTTPSLSEYKLKVAEIISSLTKASDAETAIKAIEKAFTLSDEISSDIGIISIHYTQDTTNEEYQKAQEEIDELAPLLDETELKISQAILSSPFLPMIEAHFGKVYIDYLKRSLATFKPEIIKDLQEENRLVSAYSRVISGAKIDFDGQVLNLPQMTKYTTSKDRETRKAAYLATSAFFESVDEEVGKIFDDLVKLRTKIAKTLGHKSFIPLAYDRLHKDYSPEEVALYREEIYKHIVPLAVTYREKQIERIGLADNPHYYDFSINFLDGNPIPNGNTQELTDSAEKLYHEMKEDIGEKFTHLKEHGYLDLEARKGKQGGGYEEYIPSLKSPFIFSNFNGSQGDVDVLTHEFGHALQGFIGSSYQVPCYRSPSFECCEIHSMAMEFLAYPYISYFFDDYNTKKYRFQHIIDAIFFLPYGITVDEFQHRVYENPELTHQQRKALWREIEKKYLPVSRQYGDDNPFLEEGGFWMRQSHIFGSPFYYIDYTIAQVVAFSFLVESHENFDKALEKYLNFCKLGGTLHYHELLKAGDIADPLEKGMIKELIPKVEKIIALYHNEID